MRNPASIFHVQLTEQLLAGTENISAARYQGLRQTR